MRIGDSPSPTFAPPARPQAAAGMGGVPAAPAGSAPAPDDGLIDHVAALVDRLAVQAAAGASGDASPSRDGQVLALMRDVFGVGAISDLHLDFAYEHGSAAIASATAASDGASLAADSLAVDATTFAARGTFTGEDGKRYAFTLDYAAVRAQAEHLSASAPAPSVASPAPGAAEASPPAWNLAAAIPTITTAHAVTSSLIDRLWKLLGHDGIPPVEDESAATTGVAAAA